MTRRIAIIGAGPAGSATALGLERYSGIETIMFERYSMPRRKACGSGLSPWTLKLLDRMGVGQIVRQHAYPIDGARIAGSEGDGIELRGEHETAILLRRDFDHLLAQEAASRGVELRDGVRVKEVVRDDPRRPDTKGPVRGIRTGTDEMEVDAVVDCSGANGTFSRSERPGRTLHTLMGWYEGVQDTSDVVEVFFDPSVQPHYGWIFPETDERVNIGICCSADAEGPNVRERYEQFLDRRLRDRLKGADRLDRLVGHPVKTSYWATDLVDDNTLVAGEAGHLADMATAEGIYHALLSGWVAADVMGPLLERGDDPTPERLSPYTGRVRRQLGMRLAGGRALMESLRTPLMDVLLQFRSSPPARKLLTKAFAGLYHG
jgi:geranylgeranyl reductase family protein